jgi:hypothetical protein
MSRRWKDRDPVPIHVTLQHVHNAECANPWRCTLALAAAEALGLPEGSVHVAFEDDTARVRAVWEITEGGIPWVHRAYAEPLAGIGGAIQLVHQTDSAKRRLLKRFPADGYYLTLVPHGAVKKQVRTPEQVQAEKERRVELARCRALPPSHPDWEEPPKKRTPSLQPARSARVSRLPSTPTCQPSPRRRRVA